MKKKALSLLTALCLMLTLAPAAFAADTAGDEQPTTITRPNGEVIEIPNLADYEAELAEQPAAITDSDVTLPDANGVYHITSANDFKKIPASAWYQGYTFELECDLNLRSADQPDEWYGYITFFKGTFNGNDHTISGFANNTYFIYAMIGGEINDLTIELDGNAGALIAAPGTDGKAPVETVLDNITCTGTVTLPAADQSNYSPFIYCCGKGGMTMKNCTNKAEINGNIYGGIFFGYYPLFVADDDGNRVKYVFDNCNNEADVTMKYASMFFGNPSTIEDKLSAETLDVTITDCTNTGEIRGTVSSHYFAPKLDSGDLPTYTAAKEQAIKTGNSLPANLLTVGETPEGFTYSIGADKSISISAPTNRNDVSYYLVSVSSYYSLYAPDENVPADQRYGGTGRYTITEKVSNLSAGVKLKYYGIADEDYGSAGSRIRYTDENGAIQWHNTQTQDGNVYYMLPQFDDDKLVDNLYQRYAHMENGVPVPGFTNPSFVDVVAFNENGQVIGFARGAN